MAGSSNVSRIDRTASADGVTWAQAFFRDIAFSSHRHDSYGIGYTTNGVQCFDYRGESRYCRAGDVFVLHPDELHDGRQGTEKGYGYRIAYVQPYLIAEAAGGGALPFVEYGVSSNSAIRATVTDAFAQADDSMDDLGMASAVACLADALTRLAGEPAPDRVRVDRREMYRVRDHLIDALPMPVAIETLERDHGMDRYRLTRQFRAVFGVAPHRFVTMRRLDRARDLIAARTPLAEAAMAAGFADQSHMTRHFRRAYGLTPGQWRTMTAA